MKRHNLILFLPEYNFAIYYLSNKLLKVTFGLFLTFLYMFYGRVPAKLWGKFKLFSFLSLGKSYLSWFKLCMVIEFVVAYKNKIYLIRFVFGADLWKTLKVKNRHFLIKLPNPRMHKKSLSIFQKANFF